MASWNGIDPLPLGWTELGREDERDIWRRFERKFDFRPSIDKAHWPGIREPAASLTYALPPYDSLSLEKTWKSFLRALQALSRPGQEELLVLDWQHQCYRFRPADAGPDWVIHPIPEGEYHIFLDPQLRYGTFGHPWELSLIHISEPTRPY